MADTINPLAPTPAARLPASKPMQARPPVTGAAAKAGTDTFVRPDGARRPDARVIAAVHSAGDPVLPDQDGACAPRHTAAAAVLDGMPYRQRHLAEAIHILTHLAAARMEAAGHAKTSYGRTEAAAAMAAALLELKQAMVGRRAALVGVASELVGKAGDLFEHPVGRVTATVLDKGLSAFDKTFGYQRQVDDAAWQKSFIGLRERMAKQMEDMQGNEYEKAIRLLERSLETTRQMGTGNTDTLRSISHNL